jgi:hypothetical protein
MDFQITRRHFFYVGFTMWNMGIQSGEMSPLYKEANLMACGCPICKSYNFIYKTSALSILVNDLTIPSTPFTKPSYEP